MLFRSRDPNHYWAFGNLRLENGRIVAGGHGYFKPDAALARVTIPRDDFKATKQNHTPDVGASTEATATQAVTRATRGTQNTQTVRQQPATTTQGPVEAVKAVGRVRVPPGTTPTQTLTVCEAAEKARARSSPAAPGLAEKCRAERAIQENVATSSGGVTAAALQPENTIKVRVRYRKALGYKGGTNAFEIGRAHV